MAIVMRQGEYEDFVPAKMRPGEWAVVLADDPVVADGRSVFVAFAPGVVKRMATYEDMVDQFGGMTDDIIKRLVKDVNAVIIVAESAAGYANTAADNALMQAQEAEKAANMADNVAADLIARRDAGEFKGDKGDKGDTGPQGESGVVVPVSGTFVLSGDENGDLWAYYLEGSEPPQFEYNPETGDVFYIIPENEESE